MLLKVSPHPTPSLHELLLLSLGSPLAGRASRQGGRPGAEPGEGLLGISAPA